MAIELEIPTYVPTAKKSKGSAYRGDIHTLKDTLAMCRALFGGSPSANISATEIGRLMHNIVVDLCKAKNVKVQGLQFAKKFDNNVAGTWSELVNGSVEAKKE